MTYASRYHHQDAKAPEVHTSYHYVMFSAALAIAVSVVLSVSPPPALAWGKRGHRVVATLATTMLTPAVQSRVADLLEPGVTLADVATWADEVRSGRSHTAPWHTVNIPQDATSYKATRDCRDGCVPSAIDQALRLVRDSSKDRAVRGEALRWAVHFVADLHQPLHTIADPSSATYLRVQFFGRRTNLHRVWDEDLIDHVYPEQTDLQERVQAVIQAATWGEWAQGRPQEWAEETHRTAKEIVALFPVDREIDGRYIEKAIPIIRTQLAKASVRLAWALNQALGNCA